LRVLIVGSLDKDSPEHDRQGFISACREVGAALARAKIDLVVGSTSPNTADRWVLEGASSVAGKHKVWVFRPDDGPTPKLPSDETSTGQFLVIYKRLRGPWAGGARLPDFSG
jgi:hypothetical protein